VNAFRLLSVKNLSDRIREILDGMDGPKRGKQTRLAVLAGCTKGLISQLLNNEGQELGYQFAKNIEKKLGYRVDWILEGHLPKRIDEAKAEDAAGPALDGEELIELALLYRQATQPARVRILEYARAAEKLPSELRRVLPINNA
jgi:transcriptional regulator with XRE-family HTH domain